MLAGAVLPFWLSYETQKLQALIPGTLIPIKQLGTLHFTSRWQAAADGSLGAAYCVGRSSGDGSPILSGVARALNDPFRDYAHDSELRLAIGHKLMELVANGVNDPVRLGYLTLKSLPRQRH